MADNDRTCAEQLEPWPVHEEGWRQRRNAVWGQVALPVAGPGAEARTPPAEVARVEAAWHAAFCAHPDNCPG